jgi:hypothetical protein
MGVLNFYSLKVWSDQLGRNDEIEELVERQHIRTKAFEAKLETLGGASFLRYHEQILALRTCLVPPNEIATCLDYCESYIRDCFPMNGKNLKDTHIFKSPQWKNLKDTHIFKSPQQTNLNCC